jgi:hypothetical protein
MDRPTGLNALELEAELPAEPKVVRCELSKGAYNAATRGKLAYFWLSFLLAVVLAVAAAFAVISFNDEESGRGFLALITAVGALLTSGVFAILGKRASADADKMWTRVDKYCQ